jgi:AcrR family transcriptional regulator
MGLRERKAQRTRETIAAAAWALFDRQGYDETTMEQIAEAAEVAPTTLYRYFATKDGLLAAHLLPHYGRLSDDLRERPPSEPLDEALGRALLARLERVDADAAQVLRVRAMIDAVPARARIWDDWYQETSLLESAIAERADADPGDLWVQLSARTCMTVMQMSLDAMRLPIPQRCTDRGREILEALDDSRITTPRLPGR